MGTNGYIGPHGGGEISRGLSSPTLSPSTSCLPPCSCEYIHSYTVNALHAAC